MQNRFAVFERKSNAHYIVLALHELGGRAHRQEIVKKAGELRKFRIPENWEETVQNELQRHCRDSQSYETENADLFIRLGDGDYRLVGYPNFPTGYKEQGSPPYFIADLAALGRIDDETEAYIAKFFSDAMRRVQEKRPAMKPWEVLAFLIRHMPGEVEKAILRYQCSRNVSLDALLSD